MDATSMPAPENEETPFAKFVKARLAALDITAAEGERRGHLTKGFIGDILRGKKRSLTGRNLAKLAIALSCTIDQIAPTMSIDSSSPEDATDVYHSPHAGDDEHMQAPPSPTAIPETETRVGAGGIGAVALRAVRRKHGEIVQADAVHAWWQLPDEVVYSVLRTEPKNLVITKVMTDSMEPEIQRTDYAVIDVSRKTIEPDAIWMLDNGFGVVLKRVIPRRKDGELYFILRSANKAYPDETRHSSEVTIIGKYVGRFTVY